MTDFNLIFDNPNKFYFDGEKISGKFEVITTVPTTLPTLSVNFLGRCHFSNEPTSNSVFYDKELDEIFVQPVLVLSPDKKLDTVLGVGVQCFAFEYQLKKGLPSSLECDKVSVRYSATGKAEFEEKFLEKTEYFTVVQKVDLTDNYLANLPVMLWRHAAGCMLMSFCNQNAVRIAVHVLKAGFVPGETLHINAEITNMNRQPIRSVKAALIQVIRFSGQKHKRVVVEAIRGALMPFESQVWRLEELLVPSIPPTTHSGKGFVHIGYKLYFMIQPSWSEKAITLKNRIIIGSVPFSEVKTGDENVEFTSAILNASNLEQCMFGPHFIIEKSKQKEFTPLYPNYLELY